MITERFRQGAVVPAHPLALTADRRLDERHQRCLTRYYLEAQAGGLAVGVHTTQFGIHDPAVGLLAPVLELAASEATAWQSRGGAPVTLVAGAIGDVTQAVAEAELAASLGYDAVLLSPVGGLTELALIERARAVGEVLPVIGFYLQPAVGGRVLSRGFWTKLAGLSSVVAIKVAAFDRYKTLDVLHGVAASGRSSEITLFTGNDDHILIDLITPHEIRTGGELVELHFSGGLLGQWSVWTQRAVGLSRDASQARRGDADAQRRMLAADGHLTDANGALFDVANDFRGCIAGIHDALRRQGLMQGRWCLDPNEDLSPGQAEEIDRIWGAYPDLRDDEFVAANLDRWLA